MSASLHHVLTTPARREQLIEAGLARAASAPGWPQIAKIIGGANRRAYESFER
jgi:hypothetical protein